MSDSLQPRGLCSLPGSSVHGIFRQEYWSGLPFPPPGDLPNLGIKPVSPALAGVCFSTVPPGKSHVEKRPTLIQGLCAQSLQSCPTLCGPYGLWLTWLLCPWDSPGKNDVDTENFRFLSTQPVSKIRTQQQEMWNTSLLILLKCHFLKKKK